jgi:nucleoside-diphosphate-sugar epimerase
MRCLVTGVAGFVGSTLAERLLKEGHSVIGIDCFLDYYARSIKEGNIATLKSTKGFEWVEGSLLQLNLSELLQDVQWVFHQAGQAGVRASWGGYFSTYIDNNILATQKLLEALLSLKKTGGDALQKLVYASSSSVYGNAERFPTSEALAPHPVSPYGVTKLAAEHLVSLYATEFGLPTSSLRYFTVFGPRQRPDMAFHRFIKAGLRGETLTLYGDGEQSRDFTYIDDIVEANILAAKKGAAGGVYNVGGGTQATVNEVLAIIRSEIPNLKIERHDRQVGDARHTSADTTRAREILGFAPQVDLQTGILREVAWMRAALKSGHVQ